MFRLQICLHLTNKPTPSVVARNYRYFRIASPPETCLSNKSRSHSGDEDEQYLQYSKKRCGKMNHTTPLFIQKISYATQTGVRSISVSSYSLHTSVNWIGSTMCKSQFNCRFLFKFKVVANSSCIYVLTFFFKWDTLRIYLKYRLFWKFKKKSYLDKKNQFLKFNCYMKYDTFYFYFLYFLDFYINILEMKKEKREEDEEM